VVKGQIDLLRGYHKNANRHLNDLWLAGVQFGLAQDQDRAKLGPEVRPVNGVANSPDHDGNQNGNNNGSDVTNYSRNGTKSFTVAKHSFSPFQRSKSAPSGAKQSLTSDLPEPVIFLLLILLLFMQKFFCLCALIDNLFNETRSK